MGFKPVNLNSSYIYLDDYEKYNPEFKHLTKEEIEEKNDLLVEEIRNFYQQLINDEKDLDLLTWTRMHLPSEEMSYKDAAIDQMVFIRDKITRNLFDNYEMYEKNPVKIISTHMSKSIVLPVYLIDLQNIYGIKIIMRGNFYDWKISISSNKNINCDFDNLITDSSKINSVYCEGFKEEWVYDAYNNNKKQFTIETNYSFYELYTFFYLLGRFLKKNQDPKIEEVFEL